MKSNNQKWRDRWRKVWESKTNTNVHNITDLIKLNGYDSGADSISILDWEQWILNIKRKIIINKDTKILDLGSGCGAFIFSLKESKTYFRGVDYSHNLCEIGKMYSILNGFNIEFIHSDILDTENYMFDMDIVFINSTLQYIDEKSAISLFKSLLSKQPTQIFILETPDKTKKYKAELFRAKRLKNTDKSYFHIYHNPKFFNEIALEYGYRPIQLDYILGEQSKFRWSYLYERIL